MSAMHRIGLLVPSSNTTMETEVPALLRARERERPEDAFTIHSARLRMDEVTPDALRAMNAQTERATVELADLRPDVVATACLVAIMAQGPGQHRAVETEIESVLAREHAPAPALSSALDPEDLKRHWQRLDLDDCDALVLSACVQMPSLSVLEEVEQRSGLPTLSAATATTWAVLRALDLEPVAPGAGALLRSGSKTVTSTT